MLDPQKELELEWWKVVFALLAMLAIFMFQAKLFGRERIQPMPPFFPSHYGCSATSGTGATGTLSHWTLDAVAMDEDGSKTWRAQLGMWEVKSGKEATKLERKMFDVCSEWMRYVESHAKPPASAPKDPKI